MNRHLRWGCITVALLSSVTAGAQRSHAVPAAQSSATTDAASANSDVLQRTVAVHLENVRLKAALRTVGEAAGVTISYVSDAIASNPRVSLVATQITLKDAMDVLLQGTGLEAVALSARLVVLQPAESSASDAHLMNRYQGTGTISGFVRDSATGGAVPGATIHIDGTTLQAKSGPDGAFRLTGVAAGEYRVTTRRVGYLASTRTVNLVDGQSVTINFQLNLPATKLDEVVTTAVGEQRRYQVGNVISTINVDSIAPTAPVTSITDLISGRAPGVEVEENSGLVGSGQAIRIRGISSIVTQGDPIIIVDGIREDNSAGSIVGAYQYGSAGYHPTPSRINDINFDDVASIDILKGPAATTEYGTDAAAGVIVITTKHGAAGTPLWHADAEQTTTELPDAFPQKYYSFGHSTDGTNTLSGSGSTNYGGSVGDCALSVLLGGSYASYGPGFLVGNSAGTCIVDSVVAFNPLNNPSTTLFTTGLRQKYDVSVSGGSDAIRYFIAGGMSNENGDLRLPSVFQTVADTAGLTLPPAVYRSNTEEQRSIRLNMQAKLNTTMDVSTNVSYMSTASETPDAAFLLSNAEQDGALDTPSNLYGYIFGGASAFGNDRSPFGSPFGELSQIGRDRDVRTTAGLTFNWRPAGWLASHATFGLDHGSDQQSGIAYPIGSLVYGSYPSLDVINGGTDIYTMDLRAAATGQLTRSVQSVTSVGLQMASTRSNSAGAQVYNITLSNLSLDNYSPAYVNQSTDASATLGGYVEEQLSLNDRLFVIGAVRIDGASGFGNQYSVAAYPKISASWLALNTGGTSIRFRGALGAAGVQPPDGSSLLLYNGGLVYAGGQAVSAQNIEWPGNAQLRPERSEEFEGGVDISGWGDRASLELTIYRKYTHDAIVNTQLSGDVCCYTYPQNIGDIQNGGVEIASTVNIIETRRVLWSVTLNGSLNANKLTSLAKNANVVTQFGNASRIVVGYPLYGLWGYPATYSDLNHDGIIEPDEVNANEKTQVYLGPDMPTREGSLSSHLGLWRNVVSISGLLDYGGGFRIYNAVWANLESVGATEEANIMTSPQWMQAIYANPGAGLGYSPAGLFEDGTYIRFRELSVTYSLPASVAHRLRLVQDLSITGAVRNLALWTKYIGIDPEVTNGGYNSENITSPSQSPGSLATINNNARVDNGAVPLLRDWVIRLNVGLK